MTMDVQGEIRRIHGLLEGHDKEIGGLREQASRIEGATGRLEGTVDRIESKLNQIISSGPHPVVTSSQSAIEPSTGSIMGNAVKLANKPVVIHALYLGTGVLILTLVLVWQSGRPISDFLPGLKETSLKRSGITLPDESKEAQR